MNKYGFTLIELLITIAIIGVLTAVVLSNLFSAREKAVDAYVKTNMNPLSSEAAVMFDRDGNYDGFCDDVRVQNFLSKAADRSAGSAAAYECEDNLTSWAAAVPLRVQNQISDTSGVDHWCVDGASSAQLIDATTTLAAGTPSC